MKAEGKYHAEIMAVRGKTYLKPEGREVVERLKRMDFRTGGVLFASVCKKIFASDRFAIDAARLPKTDPFAVLMGDAPFPVKSRRHKATTTARRRIVRVCVECDCRCRGYNCSCKCSVAPCR